MPDQCTDARRGPAGGDVPRRDGEALQRPCRDTGPPLSEHGLPVDVGDPSGNTLLMLAAYHGHAGTVRALIRLGTDPDLRNARDETPVAGALFKGADDVVAVLRQAAADLDPGTPTAGAAAAPSVRAHLLAD
ncbi:ankyrin repeat domain-containing protein [Streptomyces sp. SID625]|nr:ankyrin repeat domain-containing protein [Streptomyces sp. SID625]